MNSANKLLIEWCQSRGVRCELLRTEDHLRAYFIHKEDKGKSQHFGKCAERIAREYGMHSFTYNDKNGRLAILSESEINESISGGIIDDIQRRHSDFYNKLRLALMTEAQIKSPKEARKKSDATDAFPAEFNSDDDVEEPKNIDEKIDEALDGMATPYNIQPNEVIERLQKMLADSGMDKVLKKAGVVLSRPEKGLHTISVAVNNVPVLKKDTTALANEKDLAMFISELESVSRGDAPESGQMEADRAKKRESDARTIAQQYALGEPTEQI